MSSLHCHTNVGRASWSSVSAIGLTRPKPSGTLLTALNLRCSSADAALRLQVAVRERPAHFHCHALQPRFLALGRVQHFRLQTTLLRPAQVHPQQHLRPVLGLGPAGTGMDLEDGVRGVVLSGEQVRHLDRLGSSVETFDGLLEIPPDVLALAGQFEERLGLLEQGHQLLARVDADLEPRALLLETATQIVVAPDVRAAEALLQLLERPALAFDIKETSAVPRPCR